MEVGAGEAAPKPRLSWSYLKTGWAGRLDVSTQSLAMTIAVHLNFKGQAPASFWLRWRGPGALLLCVTGLPWLGAQHLAEV